MISERIKQFGEVTRNRLKLAFQAATIKYPPRKIIFLGIKKDKVLQLYAENNEKYQMIKSYPILKASGKLGPKLREGDLQVPEGIYKITSLNPKSRFHLSLKLNYPNEFDLHYAKKEKRKFPGSDIFIHGGNCSVGCLAMGDPAIEELFVLTNEVGLKNIKVIITPVDFRKEKMPAVEDLPAWSNELYDKIKDELLKLSNI